MDGLVIKNTGSWYTVKTSNGKIVESKIKGNFRLKGIRSTNPIAVGDNVEIKTNEEGTAFITDIRPRHNYIIRKSPNLSKQSHIIAANIDQACLVVTITQPETSTIFIDRFIASAEAYRIPIVLLFNKQDILNTLQQERQEEIIAIYKKIGYKCLKISAKTEILLNELNNLLKNKITLLSGNSGVGKSTIINKILPNAKQKTAAISDLHGTGTHTTTFSEMLQLPEGGYIIDTPGIKGFGTFDIEKEELNSYFKEIFITSKNCKFNNCTHTHEPGCAVIKAIQQNNISISRYQSYLNMLEDKEEGKYRAPF